VAVWVRLGLSAVVFPLLYRAVGEEGQGWGGGAAAVLRRSFFALLGAFIFFQLSANWQPREQRGEQGRGFQAFASGVYYYRLSHTPLGEMAAGETATPLAEQAVQQLQKAVELLPESVSMRRYLGTALAERREYARALQVLEPGMKELAKRAPERAQTERQLWHALYGPQPPARPQIERAQKQLQQYGLGWLGRVAVLAAYQRLGSSAVPAGLRRQVKDEATHYFWRLATGVIWTIWLLPQLGLIALVAGTILIRTKVLRPAPPNHHPVGAILWESFILMMSLGPLASLVAFQGKRPSPEQQPGAIAALLLAADVMQVLAIAYLWWRLRGRGLTLAEVGLTRRDFWANVGAGVMAAVVMVPAAFLIGILTQMISDRLFPNIAPPYHPLQGMTATSSSAEIRWALFLAAAVGAPLLEETFFRGALFGALRRRYGFWPGLAGSAAFFAILHPQLPLGFIPIAFLGAVFAALYDWRQSLVPAMVAHALNNGMAFLLLSLLFPAQS
jgi:membrane protease YdiL (CAAX protease family)